MTEPEIVGWADLPSGGRALYCGSCRYEIYVPVRDLIGAPNLTALAMRTCADLLDHYAAEHPYRTREAEDTLRALLYLQSPPSTAPQPLQTAETPGPIPHGPGLDQSLDGAENVPPLTP